jgi:hypothetical protein
MVKSFSKFLKEDWAGMHDAHQHLANSASTSAKYSGKGHYIKKNGKYLSKRHDSVDAATKDWQSRPDHEKTGSKIVHE